VCCSRLKGASNPPYIQSAGLVTMCQTAQILESLHSYDTIMSSSIPSGLLLANDSDQKRTHLLIHQSARLPSPALMVTNLDASNYPSIRVPVTKSGKTQIVPLTFDRILCDVPCSGDGTIRKNMGIWKSWQPMDGNGLHRYVSWVAPGFKSNCLTLGQSASPDPHTSNEDAEGRWPHCLLNVLTEPGRERSRDCRGIVYQPR